MRHRKPEALARLPLGNRPGSQSMDPSVATRVFLGNSELLFDLPNRVDKLFQEELFPLGSRERPQHDQSGRHQLSGSAAEASGG